MIRKAIILTGALVAACSCLKIQEDDIQTEIFFNAVAYKSAETKAEKAGPIEGSYYGYDCPDYTVYLSYLADGTWAANTSSSQYYAKATCKPDENLEIWYSDPATYWPLSGKLTFVGFSPASVESAYDVKTGILTANNYSIETQKDVLYSCAADAADLDSENYKTLTDSNYKPADGTDAQSTPGVPIKFRHALAQISVTIDALSTLTADVKFEVTALKFTESKTASLRVTQGQTAAGTAVTWASASGSYEHNIIGSTPATIRKGEPKFISDSNADVTGNQGFLIFPQAATIPILEITYSQYQNSGLKDANGDILWSEAGSRTATVDLSNGLTSFDAGKKYVLKLTLSANQIKYSPSMHDWDDPISQDYNIPNNN